MNLGATTLWSELKRPTELFPASQKPLLGNSPQGFPTQPCIIEHLPRFSNSTLYHRTPISNFLPSLLHPGAFVPLALANAEAQISAFQGHSFGQIFVLDLNRHCAGTYFATVRTIVAMAVMKAKTVVLVSLQPSSSALNSSAMVTR